MLRKDWEIMRWDHAIPVGRYFRSSCGIWSYPGALLFRSLLILLATSSWVIGVSRGLKLSINSSSFYSSRSLKCALKWSLIFTVNKIDCCVHFGVIIVTFIYFRLSISQFLSSFNILTMSWSIMLRCAHLLIVDNCSTRGFQVVFVIFGKTNCFRCCIGDTC